MNSRVVLTFAGLLVLTFVAGHFSLSCSDDDDASLENDEGEDDDDLHPDDDNITDDDFLDDDDTSPDNDDDDDDDDDDDLVEDDDDTSSPDADCIAAYTNIFACNPDGLGDYSLEEWIEMFCYGSTDPTFGIDGFIVQCYLGSLENGDLSCLFYSICINEIFNPPVLNQDCVDAYETLYECHPEGIGNYTAEEFIDQYCYETTSPDSFFGYNGDIVQCFLDYGDICDDYIACVYYLFQPSFFFIGPDR